MGGLAKICKMYGGMNINGVKWVWDYNQNKAVIKSEQTKEDFMASEKVKWAGIKERLKPNQ